LLGFCCFLLPTLPVSLALGNKFGEFIPQQNDEGNAQEEIM